MKNLQRTISRIQKMEQYFDEVTEAVAHSSKSLHNNGSVADKLKKLCDYYENGLWLHDYECDEQGMLPVDLKRGVLSQDGLYNLLREVNESSIAKKE